MYDQCICILPGSPLLYMTGAFMISALGSTGSVPGGATSPGARSEYSSNVSPLIFDISKV